MPGSTAEDPSKAKVTAAANGVFVRPVAVAGIFRPAEERPPALPEKRRFSALVGDLRPCSSGEKSDDFARRRQSWDTRQKEVPFGQALLKKTPKNTSSSSLQASQTDVAKNGIADECNAAGCRESENFASESKQSSSIKISESLKSHSNSSNLLHGKDSAPPVLVEENKAAGDSKSLTNNPDFTKANGKDSNTLNSQKEYSISHSDSQVGKSQAIKNRLNDVRDSTATVTSNQISNAAENTKQLKKVYGLTKRDVKSETSNVVTGSSSKPNVSVSDISSSSFSINDAPKAKSKVYGLNKSSKKDSEDIKTDQESVNRNLCSPQKVINESKVTKIVDSKNVPLVSELEACNKLKENEFQKSISPPKDFRPLRRTSDVIAAKIQNMFSNVSPADKSSILPKKSVGKISGIVLKKQIPGVSIKGEENTVLISKSSNEPKIQNQNTVAESKIPVEKESISETSQENSSKNSQKSKDVVSLNKKKNGEQTEINKYNVSQQLKSYSEISSVAKTSSEFPNKVSCSQVKQVDNIKSVKEDSLLKEDSKTKHSIETASSNDKKNPCIDGKMPTKKPDQNSSDGTLLLKTTNQETDRKSTDSAFSLSTTMEEGNKGAVLKNSTSVINIRGLPAAKENSAKIATSINNSSVSKTHQISVSETLKNGSHEATLSKIEASMIEKTISKKASQQVFKTSSENITVFSTSSKVDKLFSSAETNGCIEPGQVAKVEVTKITPSTVPGIVPTVNVLFRTKSPQGSAVKEENRKKVVVETFTNSSPIPTAFLSSTNQNIVSYSALSNASQSVKEAFKAVESVQNSLTVSPKATTKRGIVNLQNEELTSVSLKSITDNSVDAGNNIQDTCEHKSLKTDNSSQVKKNSTIESNVTPVSDASSDKTKCFSENSPLISKTSSISDSLNKTDSKIPAETFDNIRSSSSATCLYNFDKSSVDYESSSETKINVLDLGDWNKKFQTANSEAPRAPLRRKSQRESLPPSLPLRTTSRFGSLRRIEDSSRYVPRSPSHNSLPQRYSYTEMLSKVCSMGVLPFVEPLHPKSCSSSSSQVSELWSELGEEQSTATHASEMLEAETSERMRLEKEVQELQNRYSHVQQKSDKMEMEIMESRVYRTPELNGDLSEDEDAEGNSSLYKQKYERAIRDMEIMKRRIQQQHEEEMEQKSMLKKASDKRLAEALEDVEEERQVANQFKRKAQKLGAELQDLRLMLEEQMARNGELEKKQRRFDAELSAAQEELKKERLLREKFSREKDQAVHEKYSLEQDLQAAKIDSDMLHEKITQLNRELDELTLSSKGEEEVTQLKRAKQELERKNRDQEEELEELAAQVQMLEQAKLRLEMSLEKLRQEHRREASVREEEIEEIRASFSKKIKNLEAQLETEQDERHQLMKQKHELERCIYELSDQPPPQDPEVERRLRRDLKRTKALLRDAQSMLEHTREGQSGKTLIRQLKNQLEDSEFAKAAAVKARQAVEAELQECQSQLEEVTRVKNEAESRCLQLSREKSAIQTQLEEAEEEMTEVMKKYKAVVAQMSIDQKSLAEQNQQLAELETERQMLKDQLSEVSHKFEHLATQSEDTHKVHRLDSKVRDLESKLELEQTTRTRLEHQIARLKEQTDRMREECDSLRNKELQAQEGVRRLQRQVRDLRDDYANLQQKEAEAYRKQHELEMALENTETDLQVTKNDLRLALQRIQDLQNALEDDLDSGTDVPDDSGSDSDSSFELSVLRNSSVTPVQRCESVASNLSYGAEGIGSRTSSFSRELSAFGRMMLRRTSMDFLG